MKKNGWHEVWDDDGVIVARRWPIRWDVVAETVLGDGRRLRVAHQIRQDLWRALRGQRGFSPAVAVFRRSGGLFIRAGGQVDAPFDRVKANAQILSVLESPSNRARWLRFEIRREQSPTSSRGYDRFLKAAEGDL